MTKKSMRPLYEPPRARDLSAFSVSGQGPLGSCVAGTTPWYSCVAGPYFDAGPCVVGDMVDTSSCVAGGYHTRPSCDFGASAATICISGANQQ